MKGSSLRKRAITLNWQRNPGASGYQIRVATNPSFKNARGIGIGNRAIGTKILNGLTSGRTYFFQIRCRRTVGGKTYYGPWSNVVRVKAN